MRVYLFEYDSRLADDDATAYYYYYTDALRRFCGQTRRGGDSIRNFAGKPFFKERLRDYNSEYGKMINYNRRINNDERTV